MNVTVTVRGTQWIDGEMSRTEQIAVGTLVQHGQALLLSYTQDDAKTQLTVTPDKLVIDRRAETVSRMTVEVGMTHLCEYQTPYGTLTLGVTAHRIDNALTLHGGRITAAYRLDMGGGATENEIEILVKEVSC